MASNGLAKERPIIFNAEMVRPILSSTKTQTRRIVTPQPDTIHDGEPYWNIGGYRAWKHRGITNVLRMGTNNPIRCKYGDVGDRLWVRETFRLFDSGAECSCYDDCKCSSCDGKPVFRADSDCSESKWKPAIHMPRELSRITLEITGVRMERLQDISDGDCWDEGIQSWLENDKNLPRYADGTPNKYNNVRQAYRALWESIYGAGSWDANPFVWVITFKVLDG